MSLSAAPLCAAPRPVSHIVVVDDPLVSDTTDGYLPLSSIDGVDCVNRIIGRAQLKRILAVMAVKQRHARGVIKDVEQRVEELRARHCDATGRRHHGASVSVSVRLCASGGGSGALFVSLPRPSTVAVTLACFSTTVFDCLAPYPRFDCHRTPRLLSFSRALVGGDRCLLIVLSGTSGTGKTSLASLVAERLGIDTVIGSDAVRHVIRQTVSEAQCPVIHRSSYNTNECVSERADNRLLQRAFEPVTDAATIAQWCGPPSESASASATLDECERLLLGHYLQSLCVCSHLLGIVSSLVANRVSAVIEGVHLTPSFVRYLQSRIARSHRHALIAPFLVFISNEFKHRNRFAVRSKRGSVRASDNAYIQAFPAIRAIQRALIGDSERLMPGIDNTNIDRSVALVHELITRAAITVTDEHDATATDRALPLEWWSQEAEDARDRAWSSKAMQRILAEKGQKKLRSAKPLSRELPFDSMRSVSDGRLHTASTVDIDHGSGSVSVDDASGDDDRDVSVSVDVASLVTASHDDCGEDGDDEEDAND